MSVERVGLLLAASFGDVVWSVLAPAMVVGVLLLLVLARQLARGGRLPLHDAPALRSQFTFDGPQGAPDAMLERLRRALPPELEAADVQQDEGYATMRIVRPASGLLVSLGFVQQAEPHWLGFVSRGVNDAEPPVDDADARAVLSGIAMAVSKLSGVSGLRWHKYEALTRGDDTTADELPFR